jgi:hypothetical protein
MFFRISNAGQSPNTQKFRVLYHHLNTLESECYEIYDVAMSYSVYETEQVL